MLPPLVTGIILQWYFQFSIIVIIAALVSFTLALLLFRVLPLAAKYKLQPLQGLIIYLLLTGFGSLLCWQKDTRHQQGWYGDHYRNTDHLIIQITEPLIEKNRSFKAEGYVESILREGEVIPCKGKLLIYFSKDSSTAGLRYGDRIMIRKELQAIKNSGNPGAFNYERYAAFQGIFHNVFLKDKDWLLIGHPGRGKNLFKQFIFDAREKILAVLRRHIRTGDPGGYRDELGIAEALLIGYTNDLDKDLVQAYSNTGVVHIIAISGMHLGLIYVLLAWFFARMPLIKRSKLLQAILILSSLWLFSLLTGASASVLRSAVMFSFIAPGKAFSKQSSIYNSLAASAFVMLCFDPYYLWDVGFQLSYLALAGIVVFQKPVYNCFYIKNKWIDKLWQLAAVSLAAQLLTFPVCIYYFHQFPNLFLVTNVIAVPLSAVILYAEIALLALSWIPFAGEYLGKLVSVLVWMMNSIITRMNELPFAVWDQIPSSVLSTWLLYAVVIVFSTWLIRKNKNHLLPALIALLSFTALNTYTAWQHKKQQKLIVYNVPRYQAIDIVSGNRYHFIGDSVLLEDALLQNFHLKPARIVFQLNDREERLPGFFQQGMFCQFNGKRIMIIDKTPVPEIPGRRMDIDVLVISRGPGLTISRLAAVFNCKQYVFDASNPAWKVAGWQKECEALHLSFHSVMQDGAYVYDIGI